MNEIHYNIKMVKYRTFLATLYKLLIVTVYDIERGRFRTVWSDEEERTSIYIYSWLQRTACGGEEQQ